MTFQKTAQETPARYWAGSRTVAGLPAKPLMSLQLQCVIGRPRHYQAADTRVPSLIAGQNPPVKSPK